jgi:hypothetical protein
MSHFSHHCANVCTFQNDLDHGPCMISSLHSERPEDRVEFSPAKSPTHLHRPYSRSFAHAGERRSNQTTAGPRIGRCRRCTWRRPYILTPSGASVQAVAVAVGHPIGGSEDTPCWIQVAVLKIVILWSRCCAWLLHWRQAVAHIAILRRYR